MPKSQSKSSVHASMWRYTVGYERTARVGTPLSAATLRGTAACGRLRRKQVRRPSAAHRRQTHRTPYAHSGQDLGTLWKFREGCFGQVAASLFCFVGVLNLLLCFMSSFPRLRFLCVYVVCLLYSLCFLICCDPRLPRNVKRNRRNFLRRLRCFSVSPNVSIDTTGTVGLETL